MYKPLLVAMLIAACLCSSVHADDDDDDDARIGQIKASAAKGNTRSQLELSNMYAEGHVIHQSYKHAMYWLQQAAKQHNGDAEFGIGKMYQHGLGVPQDDQKAAEWFARAAADRPS